MPWAGPRLDPVTSGNAPLAQTDLPEAPGPDKEDRPERLSQQLRQAEADLAPQAKAVREKAINDARAYAAADYMMDRLFGLSSSMGAMPFDRPIAGKLAGLGGLGALHPPARGPRSIPGELRQPPERAPPAPEVEAPSASRSWWSSFWHILPDRERNKQFGRFLLGQAVVNFGAMFHYAALSKLMSPTTADAPNLGYARIVNGASHALANVATGAMTDSPSTQKLLVMSMWVRAAAVAAIPVLYGLTSGPVFVAGALAAIAVYAFMQAFGLNLGSVAMARLVGQEKAHYVKADAVSSGVISIVDVAASVLAVLFITAVNAALRAYAPMWGNALSYAVYAAMFVAVAALYSKLKIPREPAMQARAELSERLKKEAGDTVKGVTVARDEDRLELIVEARRSAAEVKGLPAAFSGFPVRVIEPRRKVKEVLDGMRLTMENRFLRLTLLFTALELLAGEAISFGVLPKLTDDVGLYFAASSLGTGLGSIGMMLWGDRVGSDLDRRLGAYRDQLASRDPKLPSEALDHATAQGRKAVKRVMKRWRNAWRAQPDVDRGAELFRDDVLAEIKKTFGPDAPPELLKSLNEWSLERYASIRTQLRREARTGLDLLERQGFWTFIAYGVGALAYWGVFSLGLWGSLGSMFVVALLQGPGLLVSVSLIRRAILESSPESAGKIYSFISLFTIALTSAGVLGINLVLPIVPLSTVLLWSSAFMGAVGALHLVEPFIIWKSTASRKGFRDLFR